MGRTSPEGATPAWTRAWLIWIAEFFVIEGSALARHKSEDTLSDHVWAWFDVPKHKAPNRSERVRRVVLLAFLAWLGAHFLTGDEV